MLMPSAHSRPLRAAILATRTRQASSDQLHDVAHAAQAAARTREERALVEAALVALLFMRSSRALPVPDEVWSSVEAVLSIAERGTGDVR